MTDSQRPFILMGVLLFMLLMTAAWLTHRMLGMRDSAVYAVEDLAACEQIADDIKLLRASEAVASAGGDATAQEQALVQQIDEAAQAARLTGGWLQGIDHKPARRVGDSPYLRKPAVLFARGLTMEQLTAVLHHLTVEARLHTHELKLRTPPGGEAGNTWDADVTLTTLIYAPPQTNPSVR